MCLGFNVDETDTAAADDNDDDSSDDDDDDDDDDADDIHDDDDCGLIWLQAVDVRLLRLALLFPV